LNQQDEFNNIKDFTVKVKNETVENRILCQS